jgi:site-specific DNA-cytosine methylase
MRVLELFSGTKSVGKVFEKYGHEVISVDIENKFNPTYCINIMDFDYKSLSDIDIIWASPPCTMFSILRSSNIGRSKGMTMESIKQDIIDKGLPPLYKALEIIEYLKPKYWFIENPQTGKMKHYMTQYPFYDVCYCQYGFSYKKPTRIWTNLKGFNPKYCICTEKHNTKIGTDSVDKYQKYKIPEQLIEDIYKTIIYG